MSKILQISGRSLKNVASRTEKSCFGRKMTGNGRKWLKNMVFPLWKPHFCDFIKIKKIRSLICKISDIFCLAKYDLRWSWFFDFYLWVSKFLNLQNCIKTCFNYFFSFSQFIFSLSRNFYGCQQIQMFTPGIGYSIYTGCPISIMLSLFLDTGSQIKIILSLSLITVCSIRIKSSLSLDTGCPYKYIAT